MIKNNLPSLLIASTNPGKLREMQALLGDLPLRLLLPAAIGIHLDVEETGATYAENAALKARAYVQASGLVTLADDSGLEVDALDGRPGLHSARFSPIPGATDADRRLLLLETLQRAGAPRPWTARFRCAVAVAVPGRPLELFEGRVEGEITPTERGANGFGYDPLFFMPDLGQTMAEISDELKNQVSHRARAVQAARSYLLQVLLLGGQA